MSFDTQAVADYFVRARAVDADAWGEGSLRQFAGLQMPNGLMGTHEWLLNADMRFAWARWFVDGLVDRSRFLRDPRIPYAKLYEGIVQALRSQNPSEPRDELNQVAKAMSELAWDEIERMRVSGRQSISTATRKDLWYAAEPESRCYLCGYQFTATARDKFLGRAGGSVTNDLPLLVDFVRPRGMSARDLRVEVDHVAAVASGGATTTKNLRLACGWCNRVKSDKRSLFDAPAGFYATCATQELGLVTVPQPMWILRIVAARGRCEHHAGCAARLETHELFVAARQTGGSITPTNAIVVCVEHDPWATARWVAPAAIKTR